jgi:hypothetical protein
VKKDNMASHHRPRRIFRRVVEEAVSSCPAPAFR